jgi:hypothetical protein
VRLTVSEDFGAHRLVQTDAPKVVGAETVMRLLERNATVATRYGGGFVQSIDGQAGGHAGGRPIDWFFYVNGVEASMGAAAIRVYDGDRVWWDRHDWGATMDTPAVVGSYPEPFTHGSAGKRLPVRVECAVPDGAPCQTVLSRLAALGVPAGSGSVDLSSGSETLRVLVGLWGQLRGDPVAATLEHGPTGSGVYARPDSAGDKLTLLDATGAVTRVLGPSAGLVAATQQGDHQPVWIVSGSDQAGLTAAAGALDTTTLHDHFAVALDHGAPIALPVTKGSA